MKFKVRLPIDSPLCNQRLLIKEQSKLETLLDYHPNAPLISHIKTHPIFRNHLIDKSCSLVFNEKPITLKQGWVYLVVKPETEHTLLMYEYLMESGQRFLKVAHLTIRRENSSFWSQDEIVIDFESGNDILSVIQKYKKYYRLVGIPADTTKLKKLHTIIEREKEKGVNSRYKWFISDSSSTQEKNETKKKRVQNCFKWATDHMKEDLGIVLNINIYRPLIIVNTLLTSPETLIKEKVEVMGNGSNNGNKVESSSNNEKNCFLM